MKGLKNEPDFHVPDPGQRNRVLRRQVFPVEENLPGGRPIQGAEKIEKRRFPRSRGPHHSHDFAPVQGEIQAGKDMKNLPVGKEVILRQVDGPQDLTHISRP